MKKSICKLIYVLSFVTFLGVSLQAQDERLHLEVDHACSRRDLTTGKETPDPVVFTATPAGMIGPLEYTWAFGDGTTETSNEGTIKHTYSTGKSLYFAKVSVDYNGVTVESVSREVFVYAPPSVVFSFSDNTYTGCEGGKPLEFYANIADSDASIIWNTTANSDNLYVDQTTIGLDLPRKISAIVYKEYDGKICSVESKHATAIIKSVPKMTAESDRTVIMLNETANFSASFAGATKYKWVPGIGLSSANSANPVYTPNGIGDKQFQVTASFTTDNGDVCESSATIGIRVEDEIAGDMTFPIVANKIVVPESTYNQNWDIENVSWYNGADLIILNKWGQEVYARTIGTSNPVWPSSENVDFPSDAYYYIITGNHKGQDVTHTGSISILHK